MGMFMGIWTHIWEYGRRNQLDLFVLHMRDVPQMAIFVGKMMGTPFLDRPNGDLLHQTFGIPSGKLTVCELENSYLYCIYPWNIVIFHSFLYVYQRVCKILWMVLPSNVSLVSSKCFPEFQRFNPLLWGFFHGLNLDIKPPRLIVKHNVFVVKNPRFFTMKLPYLTVKCCSVWFFNPIGGKDQKSLEKNQQQSQQSRKNPHVFPIFSHVFPIFSHVFPMIGGFIKSLDPIISGSSPPGARSESRRGLLPRRLAVAVGGQVLPFGDGWCSPKRKVYHWYPLVI